MTETPRVRRRPRAPAVAVATLAAFLVVLTLLVVQLRAGRDPALGAGTAPAALVTRSGHGGALVTRTSGGRAVVSPGTGKAAHAHPVVTRTSGGGGGEGEDD